MVTSNFKNFMLNWVFNILMNIVILEWKKSVIMF